MCSQVFHKFSVNLCMFGPSSQPCSFSNPVFLGPKPFWGPFRYSISSEARRREKRRGETREVYFKELAHMIVGAVKYKTCQAGLQIGNLTCRGTFSLAYPFPQLPKLSSG